MLVLYCIDWKSLNSIVLEGGLESSKDKSLQIKVKQCTSATQCITPNFQDSDQFLLKMTSANTDISNFKKPVTLIGKSFSITSMLNYTKKLNIIQFSQEYDFIYIQQIED